MTVGTCSFRGLALPLHGEAELKQDTAATDFVTLTGDSSISGDFLVCRSGSTEVAYINSAGKLYATGMEVQTHLKLATGKSLKFSSPYTTGVPTTGLVKGEMFLCMQSTIPQLGVVTNAATTAMAVWYFIANTTAIGA